MTPSNRQEMKDERLMLMAYLEEKENVPVDKYLEYRERIKQIERILELK
jgi:hypothetical protein